MGAVDGPYAWLTEEVKAQYREVWSQGLTGALNYYRASPLRPPRAEDAAAAAITLPASMLQILVPTLVLWGMQDIALPPGLIDGLEDYIPNLTLKRIADASHWLVHEQPDLVAQHLSAFLKTH
jgi:pimeloyl-ACP methyl ester carboxylesterase